MRRPEIIISCMLLIAVIAGLRWLLNSILVAWGFPTFVVIGLAIIVGFIAAAFAFDLLQARSQRSRQIGR